MVSIKWFIALGVVSVIGWVVTGICFSYYYYKKSEYYRMMAQDFSCKYTTLEYETKLLRRKHEELTKKSK